MLLSMLLQAALLPFGTALAVLAAARALRLQSAAVPAFALVAGFLSSFFATLPGDWSPWPRVALDWVAWIAPAALIAALVTERIHHAAARWSLRFLFALGAAAVTTWPALGSFGPQKTAIAILAIGVLIALVWGAEARVPQEGARRPLLLAGIAGGAGIALLLDSSLSGGRLSGACAAALAASAAINLGRVRVPFSPSAVGVTVVLLGTLLANAYVYGGFSLGYVALVLGALLVDPLLAALHAVRNTATQRSWVPAALLTAIPVLVTVALAVKTARESRLF